MIRRGWYFRTEPQTAHPLEHDACDRSTLQRLGYLTLDARTREYSLGLKVYGLGRGLMKSFSLPERALRPMQRLVQVTRCTSQLAVMADDQAMYIQKVEGPGIIQFDSYVGKRTNLHCTAVGKVLLAHASEQKQEHILARKSSRTTPTEPSRPQSLRKELAKVRQRGYAIDDRKKSWRYCVAAPVYNQRRVHGG
jgi:DNA-binding IclR family transcriptional regulator